MVQTQTARAEPGGAGQARSVNRALDLLIAVSESGRLSMSDAARATGLAASTALRLLRTLEARQFLTREESGEFVTGPQLVLTSVRTLGQQTVIQLAHDSLHRLVEQTGESAYLSARGAEDTAVYLAQLEGTHAVRYATWTGRTVPLEGTAAGDALCNQVDSTGYVVHTQTLEPDVTAVAGPVQDQWGNVVAALSVVGPSFRLSEATAHRIGSLLAQECERISSQLGHPAGGAP